MFENIWALVVDDDAHSLLAVTTILKELGIQFKRNTTGANVVEQVREMHPPPDLILLDLDLPLGDPFEICRSLRLDPYLHTIPVVAMADETLLNFLSEPDAAIFTLVLPKPLPRKDIGAIVAYILSDAQTRKPYF